MDFLKILKSVEDFVYEALTWIILLPRTLLRIVFRPLRMTDYADSQLHSDDEVRFKDAISPPLLLILCVLLAHFIDLGLRNAPVDAGGSLQRTLLGSEQNLLVYRTIAFGIWALAGAAYFLVRARRPIDRDTLRAPFYEQCYLVAPFALAISIGVTLASLPDPWAPIGVSLALGGAIWFLAAQTRWVRRKVALPWWRSATAAVAILVAGSTLNFGVGVLLRYAPADATQATSASAPPAQAPARGP